jgi:putative transposase
MGKMHLFRQRYRIDSARVPGWDYAQPAAYFITVCTHGRIPWFGTIRHGRMGLSDIGWIVDDEWKRTAVIRPYVSLDAHVVMPNHFHGIIRIGCRDETGIVETPRRGVSTARPSDESRAQWKPHSLGSIINQFKSVCTKRIRNAGHPDFAWQPRFHDHIIRDAAALDRIRHYIQINPAAWERDRNNR